MSHRRFFVLWTCAASVVVLSGAAAAAPEPIPADRARQIDAALPPKPSVRPGRPRRVLIWVTRPHLMDKDPHKGYCIPYGTYALEALGRKTGAYEPVVGDDLELLLPENIERFDAIMLNNASGPWITPTADDMARPEFRRHGADATAVEQVLRKTLLEYVQGGRGLAGLHFAIGANGHWPQFRELLGAAYAGHPWNEEVGVRADAPDSPLLAAFGGRNFRVADEIYQFKEPYDRSRLRVLLSLDTAATNMNVKWIDRKDGDFALAWVKTYGSGRVFYTAFGHRTEIYWDPRLLRFYLDGIQYVTGDLQYPAPAREPPPPSSERRHR
jgi:type 1 glutamine amidotransferase